MLQGPFVILLVFAIGTQALPDDPESRIYIDRWEQGNQDYKDALSKSLLFFEGQRSGKLPADQRVTWRGDSALQDGRAANVDLVGGYYDAGDNVKFGFPMAFTATMLGWSLLEFGNSMDDEDLYNAEAALRWATDYLLKATAGPKEIFVQVGDPDKDHECWERPEDMETPRTVYKIDKENPGSDVAAETAAALAAASIVFRKSDPAYSRQLLQTAIRVFNFADRYRGNYSDNESVRPGACPFYCSVSGYRDELLWGAAWLHKATREAAYLRYILANEEALGADLNPNEFGWDDKHAGINVFLSRDYLLHNVSSLQSFKDRLDGFICWYMPDSPEPHSQYTPGGLIHKPNGCLQSVTAISFLLLASAKYLSAASQQVSCGTFSATPQRIGSAAKRQIDYILGDNPMKMSYMVGYGSRFPKRIHHRGSSLPSIAVHPTFVPCNSWEYMYSSDPNLNLLTGAVVGGPDAQDGYQDSRLDAEESEPTTYIAAPLVGALAFLSANVRS